MYFSTNAIHINEFAERIPSQDENKRSVVTLDLHKLKAANPKWTHVLLRTLITNQKVYGFNIFYKKFPLLSS